MAKKPLLVFSGGMDSSYMLWRALQEGDVYTCYIKAHQSPDKIPMELAARKKIIAFFEKKTGNRVLSDTIVNLGDAVLVKEVDPADGYTKKSWNNHIPDHTFAQAPLWQFGLQYAADGNKHSKVCMGIVMGDQISMHLGDLAAAWKHTSAFARYEQVPMEFPLMYHTKDRILKEMPKEIIPHLWICELPEPAGDDQPDDVKFVPCERCVACETMAKTVFIWERRNKTTLQEAIAERLAYLNKEESDVQGKNTVEVDGLCSKENRGCGVEGESNGSPQNALAEEE
ncbi:QueC-like queuosine biosynthesis [Ralstonia phage RSL2]|uniref:7-cyano-7-deazaguanine synthase n=1 Tax=Ralstonia phage RSL2 TaxID=1585840 RepID=A0A0A8J9J0_9CAUD|nr:QueC-like queuosine biosynthesis [Ralstonia phage RSL2]BAQ02669.1 hypothetical protein [Ralstonia phage RSL2]